MAHSGKIAFSFPTHGSTSQGAGNFDTVDIKYLPPNASSSSDLKRVTAVYYLPPNFSGSIQLSDLPNMLVWKWINATLAAGSETVAFEYTPSSDVSLSSIGIFTDSSDTNTTCNVAIYHESGLVVYRHNVDTIDAVTTKYELTGRRRHIDGISGVTLKAGMKYYIQYTQKTDYTTENFYPAYYDGTPGNYKVWYYGDVQNKQTVNMANLNTYRGVIDDSSPIFHMNEGDFFIWNGSSNVGMTPGYCYVRSNVGQTYIFTGIIGDPTSSYRPVSVADMQALLAKPVNGEFIWYCHNQTGMSFGQIWAKTVNTSSWGQIGATTQEYMQDICPILHALNTNSVAVMLSTPNDRWFVTGDKITLKSGYTSQVTSDTPLPNIPTTELVPNGIYCVVHNGHPTPLLATGTNPATDHVWLDSDSAFKQYVDVTEMYNWLDYVGNNSDLMSTYYSDGSIVAAVRDNSTYPVQSTKKYYLEINGNEV